MKERKARRTPEQIVADLEAEIVRVKARAQRKKARAHPATRLAIVAVKTIDRALAQATDVTMKGALQEARTTLAACVAVEGVVLSPSAATPQAKKRRGPALQAARA